MRQESAKICTGKASIGFGRNPELVRKSKNNGDLAPLFALDEPKEIQQTLVGARDQTQQRAGFGA
jgi:hypothetical protein